MKNAILLILLPILLAACADFKASPFTDELESNGSNHNQLQQQLLHSRLLGIVPTEDSVLKIALISDNHINYNDLDSVVGQLNRREDLDFVVHTGDMTDNSYNFEYDAFIQKITNLNHPSFVVIGNHDALGKGPKIYKNFFGEFNYSFTYQGYHFIFFNNNRLEFLHAGWSLAWLEQELARHPGIPKLVFQHINYDNADAFPAEISARMKFLYENHGVQWVVNGHRHVLGFTTENGVRYLQVPRVEDARYLVLSLEGGQYQLESFKGGSLEKVYRDSLDN